MTDGRTKLSLVFSALTTIVLALVLYGLTVKVHPVFHQLMEGLGTPYGKVAQFSFRVGSSLPFVILGTVLGVFLLSWQRRADRSIPALGLAFSAANLLLAAYLCLQAFIYVDMATQFPRALIRREKSLGAPK